MTILDFAKRPIVALVAFLAVLFFFFGIFVVPMSAQTASTWNGGSGNWGTATNWSPTTVPNNGGGTSYSVTIDTSHSVVSMDVFSTIDNFTLGAASTLNVDGNLNLVSGLSSNFGAISNYGTINLVSEFEPFGQLSNMSGANFTNFGTLAGSVFSNNSGALVTNLGTINMSGGGPSSGVIGLFTNYGTLINTSTIVVNDGSFVSGGTVSNSGLISLSTSFFGNSGTFNNSGSVFFATPGDPAAFTNSGTLNNSGTISVFYSPFGPNSFSNSGTINNSGTLSLGISCAGGCDFSNSGTINNAGTVTMKGNDSPVPAAFTNSGTLNNSGTFNNSAANSFTNSGTLNNSGTINNDSSSTISNSGTVKNVGTINNSGSFTNAGVVIVSKSGLFTTSTNYLQTAGSTLVNGTLTATGGAVVNIQAGSLGGTGTINSNVLMAGTMMPGDATGTLAIFGDYEQTGTGTFDELIGSKSNSFLDVNGDVFLDPGTGLEITLLNGVDPLDHTYAIMDYTQLTREFANGSSFWDDNYLWDVSYGQNQIDVTAVKAPEPGLFPLFAIGLVGLALYSRRTKFREGSISN